MTPSAKATAKSQTSQPTPSLEVLTHSLEALTPSQEQVLTLSQERVLILSTLHRDKNFRSTKILKKLNDNDYETRNTRTA